MKKLLLGITCFLLLLIPTHGFAVTIVDTGQPPDVSGGYTLYEGQWLAAEFSIDDPGYTITDIEGWMKSDPNKSLTLAVYGDGGETPDPSNELYSGIINIPSSASGRDWHGIHDVDWSLDAGTYWVAFEVRSGDDYSGFMPNPAPLPLVNEAYTRGGSWYDDAYLNLGVRIEGAPVPEPATMLLLGSGLAGLGIFRKKIRRRHR